MVFQILCFSPHMTTLWYCYQRAHCNTLQHTATNCNTHLFVIWLRHAIEWALVLLMYVCVCVCVCVCHFFFVLVHLTSSWYCHERAVMFLIHVVCVFPCLCVCLRRLIHSDGTWERTRRSKGVKTQAHTRTHAHTHAHIPTHTGVERGGSEDCQKKNRSKEEVLHLFSFPLEVTKK